MSEQYIITGVLALSRKYKIRRSIRSSHVYKARPHPLFVILMMLVTGALVYVGIIAYPPVYDLIMNRPPKEAEAFQSEAELPGDGELGETEPGEQESGAEKPAPVTGLRAVYLPPAVVSDPAALDSFLDRLSGSEINAVMVDVKDKQGQVLFTTSNLNAQKWNTVSPDAIDLSVLNGKLGEKGFALIARMSAFRDQTAARADLDNAVNFRAKGTTWLDNFPDAGGRAWLNPYSAGARQYITGLALDAVEKGAVMVVLEDFHVPPNSLTGDAFFGAEAAGISRNQCLSDFARTLSSTLGEKGAAAAIYITAEAIASPPNLTLYGSTAQEALADTLLLGALPYQFPGEGFSYEALSISKPLENPADTVRQAVSFALGEVSATRTIVLIQGGNEPGSGTAYNAGQIRAQTDALSDLGVEEYILYCTDPGAYQLQ